MPEHSMYGIAVDIGTTNITIQLIKLDDHTVQNQILMRNPQGRYGADIISRMRFSTIDPMNQKILVDLIRDEIEKGIKEVLQEGKIKPPLVSDVSIVGNTVMHHLFFDLHLDSLLKPPFKATDKDAISIPAHEVGLDFLTQAMCYSPPVVESFIGPDAVAVLIASEFLEMKEIRMTIDVGTNTEISIITPRGIWIASAASGPAFEGMATECGLGGEKGAINEVRIDSTTYQPTFSVIGDVQPRGLCGTGAVSAMASLLATDLFLPRGSLNRDIKTKWLILDTDVPKYILAFGDTTATGKNIFIAQTDLRMLQQSKAAIRGAIELLLKRSGYSAKDITEILLTGVFGSDLKIKDVYRIGMFPVFDNAKITQVRNGAVRGAGLLLTLKNRERVEKIVDEINYIELSAETEFKTFFLEFLPFPSK
ncbi:MAG: ASKHA domain-containing protein [Candidatus Thorarchaeota archaeon]